MSDAAIAKELVFLRTAVEGLRVRAGLQEVLTLALWRAVPGARDELAKFDVRGMFLDSGWSDRVLEDIERCVEPYLRPLDDTK